MYIISMTIYFDMYARMFVSILRNTEADLTSCSFKKTMLFQY
jgi:hypothetical protein